MPFNTANREPKNDPVALDIAIGIAMSYFIFDENAKNKTADKFVNKFIIFAELEDVIKSYPSKVTNINIKKLPVPGPKKPS